MGLHHVSWVRSFVCPIHQISVFSVLPSRLIVPPFKLSTIGLAVEPSRLLLLTHGTVYQITNIVTSFVNIPLSTENTFVPPISSWHCFTACNYLYFSQALRWGSVTQATCESSDWLVGWLIGLIGWLVGWLAGWLNDICIDGSIDGLIDWLSQSRLFELILDPQMKGSRHFF